MDRKNFKQKTDTRREEIALFKNTGYIRIYLVKAMIWIMGISFYRVQIYISKNVASFV